MRLGGGFYEHCGCAARNVKEPVVKMGCQNAQALFVLVLRWSQKREICGSNIQNGTLVNGTKE